MDLPPDVRVLLIGGTSHVGKTTLARRLAQELRWNCLSTDQLARHPGRPWSTGDEDVATHVVAHYASLPAAQLLEAVRRHYQDNVWPIVSALLRSHLNDPGEPCLVLEGSAVLPELVAGAEWQRAKRFWLTAPEPVIAERIRNNSGYHGRSAADRYLIDKFLERTLAFDSMVRARARELGEEVVDVAASDR